MVKNNFARIIKGLRENRTIIYIVCVILVIILWVQRDIFVTSRGIGYRILEVLFTVCMTVTCSATFFYVFIKEDKAYSNGELKKEFFVLFLAQLFAFIPMYTQNFMYGDDLWGFQTEFSGDVGVGLYFSRPFIMFLYGMVPKLSFLNLKYYRMCNSMFLYLFGCIIFKYLATNTRNRKLSLLFSVCAIAGCSAVDCVAYASVNPINISLMASAISFIIYLEAGKQNKKILYYLVSAICLFNAFCFYQLGTTVVFLMYVIFEKYVEKCSEAKRFKNACLYLLYYGGVAVSYLLITKKLQDFTGVASGQNSRGQFISSADMVIEKINWFVFSVIPQTITRVTGYFFGNYLFENNNMFYTCSFKTPVLELAATIFITTLIIASIVFSSRKIKSWVYVFISTASLPLTFYPFLILPESVYLTYYAVPIILLFLWFFLDGIKETVLYINQKLKKGFPTGSRKTCLCGILLVIIVLHSNNYAQKAWVNYCRDSYEYLSNHICSELNAGKSKDRIMVEGSLGPYVGGHAYVLFALENILYELGYRANEFTLAQCDNTDYLLQFENVEIASMREALGEDTLNKVLDYYVLSEAYGMWYYNGAAQEKEDKDFLRTCFQTTGQIFEKDESTIWVNLKGFYSRNKF